MPPLSVLPEPKAPLPWITIIARAIVSIACVAAGVGIYVWLYETRPTPPASDPSATGRIRLLVAEPLQQAVGRRFRAFGQARAVDAADVPARVSAVVTALHANYREGAVVTAGEALVSLDDSDFKRQVTIANESLRGIEAQLALLALDASTLERTAALAAEESALAAADLERVRTAFSNGAAQPREVDRARSAAIAAEKQLIAARDAYEKLPLRRTALLADQARQTAASELAQLSLERCIIRSPIAGVVQRADLELGEIAAPGVLVARVIDPSAIEIPILLPALARAIVHVGDSVRVHADRANAVWVDALVTRIAPEDDAATRTMTIYAEAAGSEQLVSGAFVEAEVAAASKEMRTLVPRRAINSGRITMIEDGIARNREVEVEFAVSGVLAPPLPDSEWVVLKSALAPRTMIVLDASRRVSEGTPIEAVDAKLASAPQ